METSQIYRALPSLSDNQLESIQQAIHAELERRKIKVRCPNVHKDVKTCYDECEICNGRGFFMAEPY